MLYSNRLFAVSILAFPGMAVWQRALSSFSTEMKDTGIKHDYITRLWMSNSLHDGMREGNEDKDRVRDQGKLYTAHPLMWKKPARYRPKPQRCATSVVAFRMVCCLTLFCLQKCNNINILANNYIHFTVSNQ